MLVGSVVDIEDLVAYGTKNRSGSLYMYFEFS